MSVKYVIHWRSASDDVSGPEDAIQALEDFLPHGSGFDNGTSVDMDRSSRKRVVLNTSYHHMTEAGFYDGWTDHDVILKPVFGPCKYDMRITGRDRNQVKDYIGDTFADLLDLAIVASWDDAEKTMVYEIERGETMNIEAYTMDADTYCPDCAKSVSGRHARGRVSEPCRAQRPSRHPRRDRRRRR